MKAERDEMGLAKGGPDALAQRLPIALTVVVILLTVMI